MKYLHLRFDSASLIVETKKFSNKCSNVTNVDLSNPVGVRQINNMLLYMFGYPPVPTKKETIFQNVKSIKDLAENHSYIKYYSSPFYKDSNGEYRFFASIFQTHKYKIDSEKQTITFVGNKPIGGWLTWENFRKTFGNERELYNIVISFFNDLLGCNLVYKKYTFTEFLLEIKKHITDEKMIEFKSRYGKVLNTPRKLLGRYGWYDMVFNGKIEESISTSSKHNCGYSSPDPILIESGIGYKIKFSGEILIEIEDETLIDDLRAFGILPSLLDNGVVTILGIKNLPPNPSWKYEFTKISEYNSFENN